MLSHHLFGIFQTELEFYIRMKVMHTFNPVQLAIETIYQKSSFMIEPKSIEVLRSQRIGKIK